MKNISFFLTTQQVKEKTKTVTRRNGWKDLQIGDLLRPVHKGMGLKKGEKVKPIFDDGTCIRVTEVTREPLDTIDVFSGMYGMVECQREGFPDMTPKDFVEMYCKANRCQPQEEVTRIEFEYVKPKQ
jgi:hypothetical protein